MTRRSRLVLLGVIVLIVAIPVALLTSETAVRTAARIAADRIAPLDVDGVRGRLLTGVSADRVAWRQPDGPEVVVTGFSARWRALPALTGRLHLPRIEAADVTVDLPPVRARPDDAPPPDFTLPARIELPVVIRADTLEVGTVVVSRAGRELLRLEHIEGSDLYADPRTFRARRLAAVGDPVSFEVSGEVNPAGAWPTELEARARMVLDRHPNLDVRATVSGALDRELMVRAEALSRAGGAARFEGTLRNLLRAPRAAGVLSVDAARVERWVHAAPEATVSADVELDGWLSDLRVAGTATVSWPDWPDATLDAEVHWGSELLAVRRATVTARDARTAVEASGHLDWTGPQPAGAARASWSGLQWPLEGDASFTSAAGSGTFEFADGAGRADVRGQFGDDPDAEVSAVAALAWLGDGPLRIDGRARWHALELFGIASGHGSASMQGSLEEWDGAFAAHVTPPGVPAMTVSAELSGDATGLRAHDIHADWIDGTVAGAAEVAWDDAWRVDADLRLAGVDPRHFVDGWPGRIGGRAVVAVAPADDSVRWDVRFRDGAGEVRGHAFSARADVTGVDGDLLAVDVATAIGDAEAEVRGSWSPEIDLAWRIHAPRLSTLHPDASGRFRGEGRVSGSPDAPAIAFDFDGDEVVFGDYSAVRIAGDGDIDLAGARGARAVVRAHALSIRDETIDAIEATLSGPRSALTLALNAQADATRVAFRAAGAWDDAFTGTIDMATLRHDDEAPWSLRGRVPVVVGAEEVRLDEACWVQDGTPNELCVEAAWRSGVGTRARAALTGLPLEELSAWLPLGFQYSGRVGGEASLEWPEGGQPRAAGRLAVVDGSWRHMVGDESIPLLHWHEASVEGTLREGDIDAQVNFELVDGGALRATLRVPVLTTERGPPAQRPLDMRLAGEFSDFDLVPAFVPDVGSVTGRVTADLRVTGTFDEPEFDGHLTLADGTTTIPRLGLRLSDLALELSGARGALDVRARARSGPGTLQLDGRFGIEDGRLGGEATLRGDDFETARIPEAHVRVSPRLVVGVSGHAVNVEGEVRVPYARLAPADFGGMIDVSADEILIDDPEPIEQVDPWRVTARVRVLFGDVQFDGFGLTARVTGAITAIDAPGEVTRATGELQVQEGRYQAWGQNLEIEHGRLVFAGGPITNPGIDVLAVRRPQDVTVGVNVRGTLREPEMRLHADPAMPQSEALSWLVLGTPLGRAPGSERALLDRTRDTAQLAGGDLVVRELGRRIGLTDVGIERGDALDEAALVIGHYLSPRLYVGYGIGIFENPANSIRLRYHLDRNWSIEAETGERATSADVRFTIER